MQVKGAGQLCVLETGAFSLEWFYHKDTEPLYHAFMYSLVSLTFQYLSITLEEPQSYYNNIEGEFNLKTFLFMKPLQAT